MTVLYVPGTPGETIYAGRASAGGVLITTLSLVNDTMAEQAGGFVSKMFGQPFVQGAIPAGQWPQFETEDFIPCPYTHWGKTTWPDGSLKWMGFMVRFPQAVPALGSKPLRLLGGGGVPTSGSRSLANLTAADLKTEIEGITNLTGSWLASLNTAITDAQQIITYCNGAAGAIWRILGDWKQSGTPHGQGVTFHYVAALQNSDSGLLHLRYLGRHALPWCDITSPTPTRLEVSGVLKSGATTIRTFSGHDASETPGSTIGMAHYTSFFTCGTDAQWDFVQGGGSASADCTVRVLHEKSYFVKSKLVPPYDVSLSPSSSVAADYYPYGRVLMARSIGATGERDEIAVTSAWAVRHLMTQSAHDEKIVLATGLASAGWRQTAFKASTGQIVPTAAPSASYTGLGTVETTWRGPLGNISGFQSPAATSSLWSGDNDPSHRCAATYYPYLVSARPEFLDLLQEQAASLISNLSASTIRTMNVTPPITVSTMVASGTAERNVIVDGVTYSGGGLFFYSNLQRIPAWASRDIAQAAAISPDVCPAGTEKKKYFTEVITNCHAAINAYNTKFGADWAASGILVFDPREYSNRPWCSAYLSHSVCHQASILGTTEAVTLRAYLSQYWANQANGRDLIHSANFYGLTFDEGSVRIEKGGDMMFPLYATFTFSTSTNGFAVSAKTAGDVDHGSYRPSNGDWLAFDSAELTIGAGRPFSGVANYKRYYVVNADRPGNFAQLSETPGGSPITITADVSVERLWGRVQDFSPNTFAAGLTNYLESVVGAIRHHKACGDSIDGALTEANAAIAAHHPDLTDAPKYAMVSAYPG